MTWRQSARQSWCVGIWTIKDFIVEDRQMGRKNSSYQLLTPGGIEEITGQSLVASLPLRLEWCLRKDAGVDFFIAWLKKMKGADALRVALISTGWKYYAKPGGLPAVSCQSHLAGPKVDWFLNEKKFYSSAGAYDIYVEIDLDYEVDHHAFLIELRASPSHHLDSKSYAKNAWRREFRRKGGIWRQQVDVHKGRWLQQSSPEMYSQSGRMFRLACVNKTLLEAELKIRDYIFSTRDRWQELAEWLHEDECLHRFIIHVKIFIGGCGSGAISVEEIELSEHDFRMEFNGEYRMDLIDIPIPVCWFFYLLFAHKGFDLNQLVLIRHIRVDMGQVFDAGFYLDVHHQNGGA
jgi:hypothetical protein